jgi:protein subunit release factor B
VSNPSPSVVSPEKQAALDARMAKLRLVEEDLVEKFILGSGSGGQKINKTSSCVYLKHLPSGIEVKCQAHRSRQMNRFHARSELCDRLEGIRREKVQAQIDEVEKQRRQNRPLSRRSKQRSVAEKRKQSQKKSLRRPPADRD